MNFSSVRGYNAYAQFTAKIREATKAGLESREQPLQPERDPEQGKAHSLYSEPIDIVTISFPARNASAALLAARENTAQAEFKEWKKSAGTSVGVLTQSMPNKDVEKLLSGNGITLEENESYNISIDAWSAVSVAGRNSEKAKAIQNLLNSTPSGINWGFLLQKLPV